MWIILNLRVWEERCQQVETKIRDEDTTQLSLGTLSSAEGPQAGIQTSYEAAAVSVGCYPKLGSMQLHKMHHTPRRRHGDAHRGRGQRGGKRKPRLQLRPLPPAPPTGRAE